MLMWKIVMTHLIEVRQQADRMKYLLFVHFVLKLCDLTVVAVEANRITII